MSWVLFSVRSTFLQLAIVKIQMIFSELLTTFTLSIHIKIIAKLLKLGCRTTLRWRWPPLKMTRQTCRVPDFGYHCRYECSFYPVMFHITENYLKLSFYWYQYSYLCAILWKCRWRHNPVKFTSPFLTAVKKTLEHNLRIVKVIQYLRFTGHRN